MKKIVVFVLMLFFSLGAVANASSLGSSIPTFGDKPKIAFVWTGDSNLKADEKTEQMVNSKLAIKFPKTKYILIQDKKVYQELLIIAEEKSVYNQLVGNLDQLKREDYVKAGEKFGYDYIIVLPFYATSSEFVDGPWSSSYRVNVTLRARIVDVKAKEYIYRQDQVEKGSSSDAFGNPSYLRAQRDGAKKCLDTVLSDIGIGEKYLADKN